MKNAPIIRPLILIMLLLIILQFPLLAVGGRTAAAGVTTITSPGAGQALNSTSPVFRGTTAPNITIDVYIDGSFAGTVTADDNGDWVLHISDISEGDHSIYAQTQDGSDVSDTIGFTVDTLGPTVAITRPTNGGHVNLPLIQGHTEPGLTVTVSVYNLSQIITADPAGDWTCLFPELPEGSYSVYATAVDTAGNLGTSPVATFTLDTTRPVVRTDFYPADGMTMVAADIVPEASIVENSSIDPAVLGHSLKLIDASGSPVSGVVRSAVYSDVYGRQYYRISMIPDNPLAPGGNYTALVDPALTDIAGNYVYSRQWSFTITTGNQSMDVHGNYMKNVNTCVRCHSTHRATGPKLIKPNQGNSMDEYCNACHDGTAAPVPVGWPESRQHNYQMSIDGTTGTSSCTGCHDPHLTWSPDNPNLLQDYYYYQHNDPTRPDLSDKSEDQLCESCHLADIKDDPRTSYLVYKYNKRNTTKGTTDDYSLCLSCHDGGKAVNIAVYYNNNGGSKHKITGPAPDSSPINGHFACADCHVTHGSTNLKLLKNRLGHHNDTAFASVGSDWNAQNERNFCTSCHNNNTELYGIVARLVNSIPGHEVGNTQACHNCHGGTPVVASHAPK